MERGPISAGPPLPLVHLDELLPRFRQIGHGRQPEFKRLLQPFLFRPQLHPVNPSILQSLNPSILQSDNPSILQSSNPPILQSLNQVVLSFLLLVLTVLLLFILCLGQIPRDFQTPRRPLVDDGTELGRRENIPRKALLQGELLCPVVVLLCLFLSRALVRTESTNNE